MKKKKSRKRKKVFRIKKQPSTKEARENKRLQRACRQGSEGPHKMKRKRQAKIARRNMGGNVGERRNHNFLNP